MLFRLAYPEILEIAGIDAIKFMQGQFCNDVTVLEKDSWQWNAWLNLQGRVRWFFHLLRIENQHFLLLLRGGKAAEFAAALKLYVLRDKVSINVLSGWQIVGARGTETINKITTRMNITLPTTGKITEYDDCYGLTIPGSTPRLLLLCHPNFPIETNDDDSQLKQWKRDDIEAGIVEIDEGTSGHFIPQMLNFERLNAISFRKGCYLGQEIVARLHFKGGNKRHLYRIEFDAPPFPSNTEIFAQKDLTQPTGYFLNSVSIDDKRSCALAVLREGFSIDTVWHIENQTMEFNLSKVQ